jgi:two-component system cell cycle sensor histidine kinase/response regulator CckA
MSLDTVKVPEEFEALFSKAEAYVKNYFSSYKQDISKGTIEIAGERYILVRAESLSVRFLEFIKNMYPSLNEEESIEASAKVLFDMAHCIGQSDAQRFHAKTGVIEPVEKLTTGPVHFAYAGWASVELLPECNPSPDENFFLVYDHPQSFEADSWISTGKKTTFCTCFMNAGYSSGWSEESFGVTLVAREILCRARGDQHCRFIMAQPHRLEEFVRKYKKENSL